MIGIGSCNLYTQLQRVKQKRGLISFTMLVYPQFIACCLCNGVTGMH